MSAMKDEYKQNNKENHNDVPYEKFAYEEEELLRQAR